MRFDNPLIEGTLIRRPKTFVADVQLESGEEIAVHCGHPGSLLGLNQPGSRVLLSEQNDPKRKFKHQLEIIYSDQTPVGIHTARCADVVAEAIMAGKIPEILGYKTMRQNARYDREHRVDLLLEGNGMRSCYVTIKNATMAHEGVAYFPDTMSPREADELSVLTDIVREGNRAMLIFVAQRSDVSWFRPADHIDSDYGESFRDAVARGVETLAFRASISPETVELEKQLQIELGR